MEERFDLSLPGAHAVPISCTTRIADGVKVLSPILAQSTNLKYPVYIQQSRECSMRYLARLVTVSTKFRPLSSPREAAATGNDASRVGGAQSERGGGDCR